MRKDVFEQYYRRMVKIINYKETDKNGNERKCTVSLTEAKKNPDRYKIFTCVHPDLKARQFAYDLEIVKKQADQLRELCRILPQKKMGLSYDIWLAELVQTGDAKEILLGETFFAMAKECGIIRYYGSFEDTPRAVFRNTKRTNTIYL